MHAFLIMVHDNSYVFFENLRLIDSSQADIYVHVDKKFKDFDYDRARELVKMSELNFIEDRVNVKWGAYSQILAELLLLKAASKKKEYDYFHLISGSDLLIKPVSNIVKICNESNGTIFLDSRKLDKKQDTKLYQRVAVSHVLVNYFGSRYKLASVFARLVDKIQTDFKFYFLKQDTVKRKNITPYFGANWFSLPNDAAKFLLDHRKEVRDIFSKRRNADELFVQTILGNEEAFKNRLSNPRRFIDWSAGLAHPKILTMADYERIMNSDAFFARKFDATVDKAVIDKITLGVRDKNYEGEV